MDPIKVGVIGYGMIGKIHTLAYLNVPMYSNGKVPVQLTGVCSSSEKSCREAQQAAGFQWYTTDYRELLNSSEVDVVSICVPNHLHKEVLLFALQQGKYIYAEKPLALNLVEADEIMALLKQKSLTTGMAFEYRFIPAILRAKQLIDEGRLGRIFHFRIAYYRSRYIDQNLPAVWRLQYKYSGGGALVDLGSHGIDLTHFLLGEIQAVSTNTETFIKQRKSAANPQKQVEVDVDDFALMQVKLKNGAIGIIEASRFATGCTNLLTVEVYGSHGAIRFSLNEPNMLHFYDATDPVVPIGGESGFKSIQTVQRYPEGNPGDELSEIGWMRYHIASQLRFLKAVYQGEEHTPNLEDGFRVQKVLDAAYRSAGRQTWTVLD